MLFRIESDRALPSSALELTGKWTHVIPNGE